MGRLINEDVLIQRIYKYQSKAIDTEDIIHSIKTMPTAYDVDKVEQQIEEMFGVNAAYYGTEVKWAVDKAREIVRKGCVKNE